MKLVVRFADAGREERHVFVTVEESPVPVPRPHKLEQLDMTALEALEPDDEDGPPQRVHEIGRALLRSLQCHEGFEQALAGALEGPETCPIYLHFTTELAMEYPWEALYADPRRCFLALERRWPIARVVDLNTTEKEIRQFSRPLRVLAVLSAVEVPAEPEWDALWGALRDSGVPVEVDVIVGQLSVKKRIEQLGDPRIRVSLLTSRDELLRAMQRAKPHLVHLFCHGSAGPSPMLEMGTPADHAAQRSSVFLEADTLRGVTPTAWLLTLNCCEGARDKRGAPSMSHLLVSAGYPAVVGMRRPLADADAHLFTRSFYSSLVMQLDTQLDDGGEVEFELSSLLYAPRQALRGELEPEVDPVELADRRPNWTFPVLYLRPEPLRLRPAPVSDRPEAPDHRGAVRDVHRRDYLTAYLDTLRTVRLELHEQTPHELLARIDDHVGRMERELEAAT